MHQAFKDQGWEVKKAENKKRFKKVRFSCKRTYSFYLLVRHLQRHELTVIFCPPSAEIPLYHILNARITFSNLNGCEEGTGNRNNNEAGLEVEGQKDTPRTDTPSPSSDSSSVSSSSSSSTSEHTPHAFLTWVEEAAADVNWRTCDVLYLP